MLICDCIQAIINNQTHTHTPMKYQLIYPNGKDKESVRNVEFCGYTVNAKNFLFNGSYRTGKLYAISEPFGNFSRCLAILWAENESDALDEAVNANLLDSLQVDEQDATEGQDSEGFPQDKDGIARLGNASEPFDISELTITEITAEQWQADWIFCVMLGQSIADPTEYTTADSF